MTATLKLSRKKWVVLGLGALAIAVTTLAYTSGRSLSQGRVVFEMAPNQLNSPLTILSIVLNPGAMRVPSAVLRNQSGRAVLGVSVVAFVRTPASRRTAAARELAIRIPAGEQRTAVSTFPDLWRVDPWTEFPSGAVIVFGLETVTFADGSQWRAAHASDGQFVLPDDVELGPEVIIGELPPWHVMRGRSISLANTVSQFPISGSMDGSACIMRACPPRSAGCEYNGCTIR